MGGRLCRDGIDGPVSALWSERDAAVCLQPFAAAFAFYTGMPDADRLLFEAQRNKKTAFSIGSCHNRMHARKLCKPNDCESGVETFLRKND